MLQEIKIPAKLKYKDNIKDGYYKLRPWQKEAWPKLNNLNYFIINAGTGSGKTLCERSITLYNLQKDPTAKSIVAVPQEIISKGFKKIKVVLPNGEKIDYTVSKVLDLCSDNTFGKKRRIMMNWLQTPADNLPLNERVLITTHQTLSRFYGSNVNLDLLNNVHITIDEGHHLRIADTLTNHLGYLIEALLEKDINKLPGDKTITPIKIMTATFFRGDNMPVLGKHIDKFERHELPLDQYLKYCKNIKKVRIGILLYDPKHPEHIMHEIENKYGEKKTIAFIPHVLTYLIAVGGGDKMKFVENFVANRKNILNLVNDDSDFRKNAKKIIAHGKQSQYPLTVALAMGKEGYDDVNLARAIVIGSRGSLVEILQIFGRIVRDEKGKDTVEFFYVLPISPKIDKNFIEEANQYMNTVLLLGMFEEIIAPSPTISLSKNKKGKKRNKKRRTLRDFIDDNEIEILYQKINLQFINDDSNESIVNNIKYVLKFNTNLTEAEIEEVIPSIKRRFDSTNTAYFFPKTKKINYSLYDKVEKYQYIEALIADLRVKNFTELRKVFNSNSAMASLKEHFEIQRKTVKATDSHDWNNRRPSNCHHWQTLERMNVKYKDFFGRLSLQDKLTLDEHHEIQRTTIKAKNMKDWDKRRPANCLSWVSLKKKGAEYNTFFDTSFHKLLVVDQIKIQKTKIKAKSADEWDSRKPDNCYKWKWLKAKGVAYLDFFNKNGMATLNEHYIIQKNIVKATSIKEWNDKRPSNCHPWATLRKRKINSERFFGKKMDKYSIPEHFEIQREKVKALNPRDWDKRRPTNCYRWSSLARKNVDSSKFFFIVKYLLLEEQLKIQKFKIKATTIADWEKRKPNYCFTWGTLKKKGIEAKDFFYKRMPPSAEKVKIIA